MNYLGTEHLKPGQNVFNWRLNPEIPDEVDPASVDLSCVEYKERAAFKNLVTFYRKQKHMTAAEATAHVLRKNQFSEIAKANPGSALKADRIRRGGVL